MVLLVSVTLQIWKKTQVDVCGAPVKPPKWSLRRLFHPGVSVGQWNADGDSGSGCLGPATTPPGTLFWAKMYNPQWGAVFGAAKAWRAIPPGPNTYGGPIDRKIVLECIG